MANTKEVRKQISSIKSTRKITSALEMVAASKIKKTQDLMFGGRPYSCLLYTSPSPRDRTRSRMPSSA